MSGDDRRGAEDLDGLRWGETIAAEDAIRAGERIHEQVEVGDAPLNERHPGVVQKFDLMGSVYG